MPHDLVLCSDSGYAIASATFYDAMNTPLITLTKVDQTGNFTCIDTATFNTMTLCNYTLSGGVTLSQAVQWSATTQITPVAVCLPDTLHCIYNPQGVGMNEQSADPVLHLQSVIVTDVVRLNYAGGLDGSPYSVFSIHGEAVEQGMFDHTVSVNVSELASGMYILHVTGYPGIRFVKK